MGMNETEVAGNEHLTSMKQKWRRKCARISCRLLNRGIRAPPRWTMGNIVIIITSTTASFDLRCSLAILILLTASSCIAITVSSSRPVAVEE
jgi:hypothetical protein